MCKKAKEKGLNAIKRFIVWLAWRLLKPACKDCEEREDCVYNKIMDAKEKGGAE